MLEEVNNDDLTPKNVEMKIKELCELQENGVTFQQCYDNIKKAKSKGVLRPKCLVNTHDIPKQYMKKEPVEA